MKELNGIIIDGVVYLAKTNTEPKPRCASCELGCCDGEKMHDTICANILSSNEYFVKSGAQYALSHQWVSVEDALPEPHEEVLTYTVNAIDENAVAYYDGEDWYSIYGEHIRPHYWLPIPPLNPDDKLPTPTDL